MKKLSINENKEELKVITTVLIEINKKRFPLIIPAKHKWITKNFLEYYYPEIKWKFSYTTKDKNFIRITKR